MFPRIHARKGEGRYCPSSVSRSPGFVGSHARHVLPSAGLVFAVERSSFSGRRAAIAGGPPAVMNSKSTMHSRGPLWFAHWPGNMLSMGAKKRARRARKRFASAPCGKHTVIRVAERSRGRSCNGFLAPAPKEIGLYRASLSPRRTRPSTLADRHPCASRPRRPGCAGHCARPSAGSEAQMCGVLSPWSRERSSIRLPAQHIRQTKGNSVVERTRPGQHQQ